jgi:hypothetical protein
MSVLLRRNGIGFFINVIRITHISAKIYNAFKTFSNLVNQKTCFFNYCFFFVIKSSVSLSFVREKCVEVVHRSHNILTKLGDAVFRRRGNFCLKQNSKV